MKPLMVSAIAPTSFPRIQSRGPRPVNDGDDDGDGDDDWDRNAISNLPLTLTSMWPTLVISNL